MHPLCPTCGKARPLTRHHVYPVRHYGRKNNVHYFYLCRQCHDQLERYIPIHQKMPDEFYPAIVRTYKMYLCPRAE